MFGVIRLPPKSATNKDIEILTLRHQLGVLQRQIDKPRLTPPDRAFLAALRHRLPRLHLRQLHLIVSPDTVLRWHRDLLRRRHAKASRPKRPGRPPTRRGIQALVLRLARENRSWDYRRIHGELAALGIKVAPSTGWEILQRNEIEPAPQRDHRTWATFVRSHAHAILAADFFETVTLTGTRMYVLAVIEHATRRIRILGATAHPSAAWVSQAARNVVMDIEDAGCRVRYMIRDRDGKYPALFDAILADAGIKVVLGGVQVSPNDSITERWIQSCRHELLDRTLVCNQGHLLRILREYEQFHNTIDPIADWPTPGHCTRYPNRSPTQIRSHASTSAGVIAWAASSTSTSMPLDLRG